MGGCLTRNVPSLFDVVFALVLWLVTTDLYRFIALWMGFTSLAPLAGAFALAAMGYALHCWRHTCIPLSRLAGWTTFIILVPLGSLAYSLSPNFRDIALQVFYLSLLWASKAFFARPSTTSIRSLLLDAALAVGFVGVVLSLVKPGLFIAISQMTGDPTPYYLGRAYGFYLQPNMCAASLTFLTFLWLFVRKPRSRLCTLLVATGYMLAILLTGSRGGILMSVFLLSSYALLAGPQWDWPLLGGRLIRFTIAGGVALTLMICAIFEIAPRLTPDKAVDTLHRIKSLADYRELAEKDNSIKGRLDAQRAYLSRIAEHPFFGYGMGSAVCMYESGQLKKPSHNTFTEFTFAYGLVGLAIWLGVVLMTWQDCIVLRRSLDHKADIVLFGVLFLACMTANTILANRVLYVVFGWLLARRYPYTCSDGLNASSEVECVECHDHTQQGGADRLLRPV